MPGDEQDSQTPVVIARQGSFSVGGHTRHGEGNFDPTQTLDRTNVGQTVWVDRCKSSPDCSVVSSKQVKHR